MLPEEATGVVRINEGRRVDVRDIVANGLIPVRYVIHETATELGLRDPDKLPELMLVERNALVEPQQVIAGKNPNRGRRAYAPVAGVVKQIIGGRVIFQVTPERVDVEAGAAGQIAEVQQGRGVIIEARGGYVQGVWGNNRRRIASLYIEPDGGLSVGDDVLERRYVGSIMVTRRPITEETLKVMQDRDLSGIIGPSMDAGLRPAALKAEGVVLITEGFGNNRMNSITYNLLADHEGTQVTVDAQMPNRWETHYPEVIINAPKPRDGQRPSRASPRLTLRTGMSVRVTREPYNGLTGQVVDLPKLPHLLDNGLRVRCAQVSLITGETAFIPLANLEVLIR